MADQQEEPHVVEVDVVEDDIDDEQHAVVAANASPPRIYVSPESRSSSPSENDSPPDQNGVNRQQHEDGANGDDDKTQTAKLEERLEQLEVKLSVLSRLLHSQMATKSSSLLRPGTPPLSQSPPQRREKKNESRDSDLTLSPPHHHHPCETTDNHHDELVSPRTEHTDSEEYDCYYSSEDDDAQLLRPSKKIPRTPHQRNLSYRVLYGGMDTTKADLEYRRASAPPTSSMTAAERQWLEPQVLKFMGNEKQPSDETTQQRSTESLEALFQSPEPKHSGDQQGVSQVMDAAETDDAAHPLLQTPQASSIDEAKVNMSANSNTLLDDDTVRTNFLNYLNSYQESAPDVDHQMQEFISVPGKLESILNFGLLVCVDSFLYMITILPIRCVWSCALLVLRVILQVLKLRPAPSPYRFHRRHSYQLIQVGILFCICRYVLGGISIGKLYHWIRGQSMIKIYVLIAMVEIFDRLFSSLGQDCMESMYWNTVNRPRSGRMITAVAVVFVYATLHTLILFLHVETLNVAINSADQQLLTLLISGNFAEIKSTVFKKYNKPALFKITASDICERFKLGLFLSLILILNVCQGMEKGQFLGYLRMCLIVWCAELVSDSIKHAFITKFNFLPSKVYHEYALLIAGDVTGIGHEGVNLDHSHAVVKRIGFAQIPLVCVMVRLLQEAMKYARRNPMWLNYWLSNYSWWTISTLLVCGWLILVVIKTALGRLLVRMSIEKLRAAPEFIDTKKLPPKDKKKQA